MNLTVAVILHCLVLFTWISGCPSQSTYDVYPVDLCPVNENCLTLSDIVNLRDKYFTSNVTLVFHPGDHTLQGEAVSVADVSNFTLQGNTASSSFGIPTTRIVCNNSSLSFSGVSDLHIVSITFVSCRTALSFAVSLFQDCRFENSTAVNGGAMAVTSGSNAKFLGLTVFTGNIATQNGGAIYVKHSLITFSDETHFEENHALSSDYYFGNGGAVWAGEKSTVRFYGRSSFERNAALYGGVLFAGVDNTVSFSGNSSFKGNSAEYGGGALYVDENSTVSFSGYSNFEENMVQYEGGVLRAGWNNTVRFSGNSRFERNTAADGGALFAYVSNTVSFSGNSSFEVNRAEFDGGALHAEWNNAVSFTGNSMFEANTADYGGVFNAFESNTVSFSGNSRFEGNTAYSGGALNTLNRNTVYFSGSSNLKNNTADYGGALTAYEDNTLSFSGIVGFEGNAAKYGGALFIFRHTTLNVSGSISFKENKAVSVGGSVLCLNSEVTFAGSTLFASNTAILGGAVYALNSVVQLTKSVAITGNKASNGGGIFAQGGIIAFQGKGSCIGNSASGGGYGGGILAISSTVAFSGPYQFGSNTAAFGGGIALVGIKDRTLLLEPGTNLSFNGNAAHKRGGALYVEDNPFTYCIFNITTQTGVEDHCFIQFADLQQHYCIISELQLLENNYTQTFNSDYYNLSFENNTAIESGGDLFGGNLDSCGVCIQSYFFNLYFPNQGLDVFNQITNAQTFSELEISSEPYRVCTCMNNHPNCNQTTIDIQKYPGETLSLSLVSVGQIDGPVPSVIRAESENLTITSVFKVTQPTENNQNCTELNYPLLSEEMNAKLKLYSDEPCSTSGFPLTVHITFLPCPVGFTLSDKGVCFCEERLQKYTQNCTIESLTIRREAGLSFWVGLQDSLKPGLILHPHCPFDYCTEEAVDFTLNSTDLQCSTGRSGVLCGGCQSGYSLALGSSQCLSDCSNVSLALLLAFAAAGLALVAFLFLSRLTVAEGTLSGLIFYANVLAVNRNVFFPPGSPNILSVFIAWVNLDLGIETCFFVGLDAYSRTWLQFVFPIYIWVLVGLIMYLADVTTTFAKIIGRTNPVAVLATLFLLSYTKLLRAIMAAFSFTTLDYPDNESRLVWLYDGNIGYVDKQDGRHIALFLFSLLVFVFVFFPYTLLLLCGQWIQRKFQMKWLSPTKQLYLKAFLDAHYAPFHDKHRYWTGLLLLLRFFIILLNTLVNIESPQDPFVSLVVLLCIVSGMLLWAWLVVHRLYKKWYLDVIEASCIFNQIVLIGGSYQLDRASGGNQAALVYTSVGIAFATFIGIVISSVVQQVNEALQRRRTAVHQQNNAHKLQTAKEEEERPHSPANISVPGVTYSVVDIAGHQLSDDSNRMELTPI